jgi:hypothetical protein
MAGMDNRLDPWKHPDVYLSFDGLKGLSGQLRLADGIAEPAAVG